MLSEAQRALSLAFAENVALLSLLCQAPTAHRVNVRPPSMCSQDPGRVLSFEQETKLTSTLAFLCGISDSPAHVLATCVEELPSREGIRVVVAVNKKATDSGRRVLDRVKEGLGGLFDLLSRASNGVFPEARCPRIAMLTSQTQRRKTSRKATSSMPSSTCVNIASWLASLRKDSTQSTPEQARHFSVHQLNKCLMLSVSTVGAKSPGQISTCSRIPSLPC